MDQQFGTLIDDMYTFKQEQAVNARQDANSIGAQGARADFRQDRDTPHGSCEDHGYDVTVSPGFCLAFKASYSIQWAILELASN